MAEPIMFRRGMRWAKVSGSRGKWHCACGWRREAKGLPLETRTWPTKAGAIIQAKGWIGDATETELAIGRRMDSEDRAEDAKLRQAIGAEAYARIQKEAPRPRYKSK